MGPFWYLKPLSAEMSRSRNVYALCVFIALFLCVLTASRSYNFGNREDTERVWYKPINHPLKDPNIKIKDPEISKLKTEDSKQHIQKLGKVYGHVIKPVNAAKVRTVDSSKSDASDCSKRDLKLFETAQPVTGLVSFPGSGNTWTRHLIQQMTGIGTASVYCDGGLKNRGFPHECERQWGKTIVVKTHEAKHFAMFKKIVLLVRNPYDALLSYANFAKAGHTGHPSKQVLIQASARMFNYSLRWYVNLTRNTIEKFKGPVHVVQYEKLKTDMAKELRSLAMFLNADVSNSDIDCTVNIQEGNFHRRTSDAQHIELLRTIYNKEKLLRLRDAARMSEKLLKDAYGIDFDLGGPVEKTLFQKS